MAEFHLKIQQALEDDILSQLVLFLILISMYHCQVEAINEINWNFGNIQCQIAWVAVGNETALIGRR